MHESFNKSINVIYSMLATPWYPYGTTTRYLYRQTDSCQHTNTFVKYVFTYVLTYNSYYSIVNIFRGNFAVCLEALDYVCALC